MYCSVVVNRLKISRCCSCEGPECREAGKEPGVRQPLGMRRRQGGGDGPQGSVGTGRVGRVPGLQPSQVLASCRVLADWASVWGHSLGH